MSAQVKRIALIGNHLPRQCGIATFTTHLCEALRGEFSDLDALAVAVNDRPQGYDYPDPVRFVIRQNELSTYRSAADFLNTNRVDAVILQHEFGIFGGPAGSHIVALLKELRMPKLTTLHTLLQRPEPVYRQVLEEVLEYSDRVVVMSRRGREFLEELYGVPSERIVLIPHGIPDVPFSDPDEHKDRYGLEGKRVLLTAGLLGPNKGIEYVIRALPSVLERHPDFVYMVLGATHPNVLKGEGESYRLTLERLACQLGVDGHVIFHNRFVSQEELVEAIAAADIYITPYLSRDQIVSGTLAYTVGAGKPVISTPYWYAEELLEDGAGVLVPFRDADAIGEAIIRLLDDDVGREALRRRAYRLGRHMAWPEVGRRYMEVAEDVLEERARRPRPRFAARPLAASARELPRLSLRHIRRLTDDTGIVQHAVFTVSNYNEGYTTDDNARALLVTALLMELEPADEAEIVDLAARYLAFLWHAFEEETGRFRNFMTYDRRWREAVGSEDSHGRAIWALGALLRSADRDGLRGAAARLFDRALPAARELESLRGAAFTLLGLGEYSRRLGGDAALEDAGRLQASRLLEAYRRHHAPDWEWFEDSLTYANARLPQALIVAAAWLEEEEMLRAGLTALDWLAVVQRGGAGQFVPIGTEGFYRRGESRARFDQQPVEAQAMISACLAAFRATGEERWRDEARRAFEWFLGRNDLSLPLYDPSTGGCRDGLHPDSTNQNQGAESTLAFFQSLLELRLLDSQLAAAAAALSAAAPGGAKESGGEEEPVPASQRE